MAEKNDGYRMTDKGGNAMTTARNQIVEKTCR